MPVKILLFVPLLFSVLSLRAQPNDNQFLANYSYPIFAVVDGQQYTGTAFFYRSGDSTFLVSNYHAIKGMSPLKQSITFTTDTLHLKYRVKDADEFKVVPIDISENITGTTEVFSMVNRIDLLKIPVQLPDDAAIFYINDLIDTNFLNEEPEDIVAFGFPTEPGPVSPFYSRQQRLQGKVNPDGFTEYDASLRTNSSDSARAILNGTERYYYFIKPYAPQGYSGAPVFGKFKTDDGNSIYRFVGVIFAGQPVTKQTWAIKGSVALEYLEREL